jgi:hypothetical protein
MSVQFEVRLLGQVNRALLADANSRVCPKYVITVTAAQLAQYLRYKKVGKKTPYQIDAMSLIKLDKVAQRGLTDDGFALQDESKVLEIRDALLGTSKEAERLYLGTLVWNVRPNQGNELKVLVEIDPDKPMLPPVLKLRITTDAIWLTDSAHRHFGIVEAIAAWQKGPTKYPDFSDLFEFSVDLYNLNAVQENALFRELNAKQKKISASKAQQTDTGSALGLLKSTILAKDQSDLKLFDQNIEVNANENTRHTLMTMSVFTTTVRNMFGKTLIEEARTSTALREELAQYYCDFFYALHDNIKVMVERRGESEEITPFQNLYELIIAPAIDKMADETDEDKINSALTAARDKATSLNQDIQREEKIHSNAVVKSLSKIAGRIRYMRQWERVIELLQSSLIVANRGKYFQKSNLVLQQSFNGAVPIATKKTTDDSINIQVQDQTIREIERHLSEKLHLDFSPSIRIISKGQRIQAPDERISFTPALDRTGETFFDVEVDFEVGTELPLADDQLRLRLLASLPTGVVWKNVDKVGSKRLAPVSVNLVPGYDHLYYPDGFCRYTAKFEVTLPPYLDSSAATIDLAIDIEVVDIDGEALKIRKILPLQPAP